MIPSFNTGIYLFAVLISAGVRYSSKTPDTIQIAIPAKVFSSVIVDDNNVKWFITEAGIVSFDGEKWKLHGDNAMMPKENLKSIAYGSGTSGSGLWISTPDGASVVKLPVNQDTETKTYSPDNSPILSRNVLSISAGKNPVRWFATDKGISALRNEKWLTVYYELTYPFSMFEAFPVTSMGTSPSGDSLYAGTKGAGVIRVYRNETDAISGASVYSKWGPIILPSDTIYSVFIAPDGAQWFGTDQGVARHTGNKTLENWKIFTVEHGLADNLVQAITSDSDGRVWFGTRKGISVYNGSSITSFTMKDGLNSNNVLCIAADRDGVIWIGTDNGVNSIKNDVFLGYK